MIGDLIGAPEAFGTFALALLIFGFAPGIALAVIVRLIPDVDRRLELQAELYEVPRWERPFWVAQQLEVALRIGLAPRVEWFWGRYVWHRSRLESGLELHRQYPDSFWIPDAEEKADIRSGNLVKLVWAVDRFPGERMWVRVTERTGERLVGTLENLPVFAYMYGGEKVSFHIDDIIDCEFEKAEAEAA